jgi:cell division protein FtsW (lipid II flippase)
VNGFTRKPFAPTSFVPPSSASVLARSIGILGLWVLLIMFFLAVWQFLAPPPPPPDLCCRSSRTR